MNSELFNILSNSNKDIDNQKLMDYLHNKLSDGEKHEIEKLMADSQFMNDAMEGLENIKDKTKLQGYVDQLNEELRIQLEKKKLRRNKNRLPEFSWIYLAIVLILLLSIVAYLVIRQFLH